MLDLARSQAPSGRTAYLEGAVDGQVANLQPRARMARVHRRPRDGSPIEQRGRIPDHLGEQGKMSVYSINVLRRNCLSRKQGREDHGLVPVFASRCLRVELQLVRAAVMRPPCSTRRRRSDAHVEGGQAPRIVVERVYAASDASLVSVLPPHTITTITARRLKTE